MTLWEYVELYKSLGFSLIPIPVGQKAAKIDWKRYQTEKANDRKLEVWFKEDDNNIAVVCGAASGGLVALDCDTDEVFLDLLKALEINGKTLITKSSRGYHILVRSTVPIRTQHIAELKLDIQSEGAIVILPPSLHPSGVRYEIRDMSPNRIIEIDDLQSKLDAFVAKRGIKPKAESVTMTEDEIVDLLENTQEGERHTNLMRLIGHYVNKNLSASEIIAILEPSIRLHWPNGDQFAKDELKKNVLNAFKTFDKPVQKVARKITVESIEQFGIEAKRQVETIIDGILTTQEVMDVFAPSGVGKSVIVDNIVAGVAAGDYVFGKFKVAKPFKVWVLEFEMNPDERGDRLRLIITEKRENVFASNMVKDAIKLNRPEDFAEFERNIAELRPALVVIDPLSAAHALDEKSREEMEPLLSEFRRVAQTYNVAVLFIHHTGRERFDDNGNPLPMRTRGSVVIDDRSDVIFGIENYADEKNCRRFKCFKMRSIKKAFRKDDEIVLRFDATTSIVNVVEKHGTKAEYVKSVREQLKLTQKQLADRLNVSARTVQYWESNTVEPPEEMALKLADLLLKSATTRNEHETDTKRATLEPKTDLATNPIYIKSNSVIDSKKAKTKKPEVVDGDPCAGCPLYRKTVIDNIKFKPTYRDNEGDGSNGVMIIKQSYADTSNIIDRLCKLAHIDKAETRIVNVVKCRLDRERDPHKKELEHCKRFLDKELADYKPKTVFAIGSVAWSLFGISSPVNVSNGRLFVGIDYGKPFDIIAVQNLVMAKDGKTICLYEINDDIKKAVNKAFESYYFDELVNVRPISGDYKSVDRLPEFDQTEPIGVDTETTGLNPHDDILGVGIAPRIGEGYYFKGVPTAVKAKHVINQNLKFELKVFKAHGIPYIYDRADDPMILAKVLQKPFAGLKDLGVSECGIYLPHYEDVAGTGEFDRYGAADPDLNLRVFATLKAQAVKIGRLWNIYDEIERHVIPIIADMELTGLKIDVGFLERFGVILDKKLQPVIERLNHEFDLTEDVIASPLQLGKWLTDTAKLKIGKKSTSGRISTDDSVLTALKSENPVIELILEYRRLSKLKSTYVEGWLKHVDANGYVHPQYDQIKTTGRFGSNEPNAQNLPVPNPNEPPEEQVRRMIVAPKGFKLLGIDYSQMQLRILAYRAGDENMLNVFHDPDADIHADTADRVFSQHDKIHRNLAKRINYGITKGGTDAVVSQIAQEVNMSRDDAKDLINKWLAAYPKIAKYLEDTTEFAKKHGYVETFDGRRRYDSKVFVSDWKTRNAGVRELLDSGIQGSEADVVKKAMIEIRRTMPEIPIIMNVHDELVFLLEADANGNVDEKIVDRLKEAMVSVTEMPLKVEAKLADNFGDI